MFYSLTVIIRYLHFAIFACAQIIYVFFTSTINDCSYTLDRELENRRSIQVISTTVTSLWQDEYYRNSNVKYHTNESLEMSYSTSTSYKEYKEAFSLQRPKLMVDYNFAIKLRQAQNNSDIPLVNDIVVSKNSTSWEVVVIINNGNTMNKTYDGLRSVNVVLIVNNMTYHNIFKEVKEKHLRVLKYEVPLMPVYGTVSLFDYSTNISYQNLPYRALINQPKRKLAICAYISNYNTINEIKSFLAYYILQKIDNIVLYCSVNCDIFRLALKKEVESGYVILYEYPWPLTRKYAAYQRSIQGSQINSCYYRHRNVFEYIISQDVDEYFYSELYPYDLYTAIRKVYDLNPDKRSLAVYYF